VLGLSASVGCAKRAGPEASASAVRSKPPATPVETVLVGRVRIEPGRELPSYRSEQLERRVLAHVKADKGFPDVCSPESPEDRRPVSLTPDGYLIGVMLAASEFSETEPAAPTTRQIHIRDCRLTPNLVVARVGDTLRITNDSAFPLLPGLGSDSFNQALIQGQSRDMKLATGGVKSLRCGFSAPCGRSDVVVLSHSYFAVTDGQGEFRIEGFPADETVRINAWHPLFEDVSADVRVSRGEEKRIELTLSPKPLPASPPSQATPATVRDSSAPGPD